MSPERRDPTLKDQQYDIELSSGELVTISVIPNGAAYSVEVQDSDGRYIEPSLLIEENPEKDTFFDQAGLEDLISRMFPDEGEASLDLDQLGISEWVYGESLVDLDEGQKTKFLTAVNSIVEEISDAILYRSIERQDDKVYLTFHNNVIVELNFKNITN